MFDDYVSVDTTPLYRRNSGRATVCHLLWGDGVSFDGPANGSGRRKVRARGGRSGWVRLDALGGQSLLEFYFIDVGQGDGILIKTPAFRHLMIDGGFPRSYQDTGKNAADFVDWKFSKDYGQSRIEIDAMLASHCDSDHYGGLWDLLDASQSHELDAAGVSVESFYHAGLSWWRRPGGKTLGPSVSNAQGTFWTRLLGDRNSVVQATTPGAQPQLHGWWADFLGAVLATKTKAGQQTPVTRLSSRDQFVPGFDTPAGGEPTVRVLGPVEFDVNGAPAIRKFSGGDSINTNGVSLLLRIDYGRCRVMLTGDLNKASQRRLLDDYTGSRQEFQCDVAKSCHHGSDDISYEFLQALRPAVTVISSGDNEGHDHPRPSVIAASATTGYLQLDGDDLVTPLIYSTELARSIDLGYPKKLEERDAQGQTVDTLSGVALSRAVLEISKAKRDRVTLGNTLVVGGLIYGLINVRTDGNRILCATLDESSSRWRIKTLSSRF